MTKLLFKFLFIKKKLKKREIFFEKKGSQGDPTMGHLVILLLFFLIILFLKNFNFEIKGKFGIL